MKRLVFLLLTMVMTLAFSAAAWASPNFYANQNYDFSGLATVKVYEIVNNIPENRRAASMPEEKLLTALYKGAQKNRLELVDVRANDTESRLQNVGNRIRVAYLEAVINDMSTTKRMVPGYWDTRTEYVDHVWYDRDGKKHTDRVPYKRDVWIPETWHVDAHIDVIYTLYDENNNVVARCSDKRDRADENDHNGMLGRSANDFFKMVLKSAKK